MGWINKTIILHCRQTYKASESRANCKDNKQTMSTKSWRFRFRKKTNDKEISSHEQLLSDTEGRATSGDVERTSTTSGDTIHDTESTLRRMADIARHHFNQSRCNKKRHISLRYSIWQDQHDRRFVGELFGDAKVALDRGEATRPKTMRCLIRLMSAKLGVETPSDLYS